MILFSTSLDSLSTTSTRSIKRLLWSSLIDTCNNNFGKLRSIVDSELENSSALPKTGINASAKSCPRHEVFHSFLLDDSKQYAVTNTAQRKHFIDFLKGKNY